MADVFTYYGCPICGADQASIDTTLGICKQCGYDGSGPIALTIQQTQNSTSHGNLSVSAKLPNGTVVTITGDQHLGITYSVPFGTRITLTSTPDTHYNHLAWVGEVSGTTGGALNITAKYTVKAATSYGATYAAQVTITWTSTAHGNATVTGVRDGVAISETWGSGNNGSLYIDNASVCTLVSVPDTNYVHSVWAHSDPTNITSGNNSTTTIIWTVSKATTIHLAQYLLTPTGITILTTGDSSAVLVRESSTDGKNVTIAYTSSKTATAYVVDPDGDEYTAAPTVTGNSFTADMEAAEPYYIIVVFA